MAILHKRTFFFFLYKTCDLLFCLCRLLLEKYCQPVKISFSELSFSPIIICKNNVSPLPRCILCKAELVLGETSQVLKMPLNLVRSEIKKYVNLTSVDPLLISIFQVIVTKFTVNGQECNFLMKPQIPDNGKLL